MKTVLLIISIVFLIIMFSIEYFWGHLTIPIATSLIISLFWAIFGIWKWIDNLSLIQAKHINELAEKIRTDKDIENIIYLIEYNKEWYNEYFHGSKNIERAVDKTLLYFTHALYLRKKGIIDKKEFVFFEYNIKRMLSNSQMKCYFSYLYRFSKSNDLPFPFNSLLEYGNENMMPYINFFDSTICVEKPKYYRYLNLKKNIRKMRLFRRYFSFFIF